MDGYIRDSSMARSRFNINVFDNGDGETMVECRRIEGCTILFNRFYYRTLEKLDIHFLRRAFIPKGTQENLQAVLPAPLPDFHSLVPLIHETYEVCSEFFTSLCNEAMCEYLYLQRHAMLILVLMSHNQSAFFKSSMEKIIPVLRSGLSNVDDMVQEYACKMLLNLCSQEEQFPVSIHLREYLFVILDVPDTLENRASKRYVRKILSVCDSKVH
jgi:hypothetical protein